MAAGHESDPMEVGSESADGDGLLQRKADRINRIFSQVAECLDEDEMDDMHAVVLEIFNASKQQKDEEKQDSLIELYVVFLETVEFCSGISVELIKQAIRSFQLIEQDAEGLGSLVYDMYMEMILVEYPSLSVDMNLTPDLLRSYFRLLTEGYEEICHIRLMVVGMYGVGKTTLIRNLCKQSTDGVDSTVGIDLFTKSCEINDDGDWEISDKDERDRFYSERLQDLVNRYGKRTQIQTQDSSILEPEPGTMISDTTSSPSTPTFMKYETEKETFKKKVDENIQQTDKSFYEDYQKASKNRKIPKRKPTVSIWDFAGQSVYYSTHHFFLNARSTYIVVLDLSKKLTDKVEERDPILGSTSEGYTCHDAFKFWMKSIYIYTQQEKRTMDHGRRRYPTHRPTIILIGTHKDKLTDLKGKTPDEYAEDYFFEALKYFSKTPIIDLVHKKKFAVSKDDEAETFLRIKQEILKIGKDSPFWREKIPANFILLEKAVNDRKKNVDQCKCMSFEELKKVNDNSDLPRQEEDDIRAFLAFHNAFGNIIYYDQHYLDKMIILDPQWIIDIFKIFMSHKDIKKWEIFENYGKLEETNVFDLLEENNLSDSKKDIVMCMEHLNVMVRPIASVKSAVAETTTTPHERTAVHFFQKYHVDHPTMENFYIMPCKLPPRPVGEELQELFEDCGSSGQPPTLCMYITTGFLPPFVFHCMIATLLKVLPIATVKGRHLMFSALAGFELNTESNITGGRVLLIWCIDNFFYVTVIFKDHDETVEERMVCCKDVKRNFDDLVLSAFNFHGKDTFNTDLFEYRVKCPKCPQVPFQTAMEKHSYEKMDGLFSVKELKIGKKKRCNICDKMIKEEEALGYWFDIKPYEAGSVGSAQGEFLKEERSVGSGLVELLKEEPTIDMLADFAEKITSNLSHLANELSVTKIEYDQIKHDHGSPNTNLVFHILYKWKSKKKSLKMLLEAMEKAGCSTEDFERIVKGIETKETDEKIKHCLEKLDKNKFEKGENWGKVVNRLVDCIGKEFWILGIRLGITEEDMQKMSNDHAGNSKEHIRAYLEAWWKENKGNALKDLVKALVKSSSNIDAITDAIAEI